MKDMKKCTGECGLEKGLEYFTIRVDTNKPRGICKDCMKEYKKKYAKNNKEKIAKKQKIYYEENREEILEQKKGYDKEHKEDKKEYNKEYRQEHKKEINEHAKERKKSDPVFKLRCYISSSISQILRVRGSSKAGQSILKFLPPGYFDDLDPHIESQFEPWMTRENYGAYNSKTWDDNDPTTWKWNIDHIKPHSEFHYTTMDCEEFRQCWALSNLRPLSAKQNWLDGINRTRHKKKGI